MNTKREQTFAQKIKALRAEFNLTQQQMADMVELRKTTISNYESGYSSPTMDTLQLFMRKFDKPASYFIPEPSSVIVKMITQIASGTVMHHYAPDNVSGLIYDKAEIMNSTMSLPAKFLDSNTSHISTIAPDNSMNLAGIKKGSCVVIDTGRRSPAPDQIFAAVYDGELIIRKYIEADGKKYMKSESTRIPSGLSLKEIPEENFIILGIADAVVSKL